MNRKLVRGPSEAKKSTQGKTIDKYTKERHEEHFATCSGFMMY